MRIETRGLSFAYNGAKALSGVNMEVSGGQLVGLVGPNGSGKSTLLKCMDRLLVPGEGKVLLDGVDISEMSRRQVARRMGYVPQSTSALFPKTVMETVLMGRIPHGTWAPRSRDREIASGVLDRFGLRNISSRDIRSLSGGQSQKVIIARAAAQEPDVYLLDEPTSSLDLANQIDVMELVKEEVKRGALVIMAVHDLNLALRYCDHFVMLKGGKVVMGGDSDSLSREVLEEVYDIRAKVLGKGKNRVLVPLSRR